MRIPTGLHTEILARGAKGESSNVIAEWLKTAHSVTVTGRAVRAFIARVREERAGIARALVTEKLAQSVTADLDGLDRVLAALVALTTEADAAAGGAGEAPAVAARLSRVGVKAGLLEKQRKVIETKLKLSGALTRRSAPPGDDARRDLLARLDTLVERHKAEAASQPS